MISDIERSIMLFISEHYMHKYVKVEFEVEDNTIEKFEGTINNIYYDNGYIFIGLDNSNTTSFSTSDIRFISVGGCDFQYSELERNNRVLDNYTNYNVEAWFTQIFYNNGDNFTTMLLN